MRLIDADVLIETINTDIDRVFNGNSTWTDVGINLAYNRCLDRVRHAPTVEPKRGKWIKNGNRYCECSVCHAEGNMSGHDNYCPHCGAKMTD